jgi:hypothetical protein
MTIPSRLLLEIKLFRKVGAERLEIIIPSVLLIGLWTNLKQKMDERAIRGEKISDMRNRSTDDLGVRK